MGVDYIIFSLYCLIDAGHVSLLLPVAVPRPHSGLCQQHRLPTETESSTGGTAHEAPPTPRPHATETATQEPRQVRKTLLLTNIIIMSHKDAN